MIIWKDFILDDGLGPVLSPELFAGMEKVRRGQTASRSRVTDDASAKALIQETRREVASLNATNTGCVRDVPRTDVRDPDAISNLEDDASSHRDVENELAVPRLRGVG